MARAWTALCRSAPPSMCPSWTTTLVGCCRRFAVCRAGDSCLTHRQPACQLAQARSRWCFRRFSAAAGELTVRQTLEFSARVQGGRRGESSCSAECEVACSRPAAGGPPLHMPPSTQPLLASSPVFYPVCSRSIMPFLCVPPSLPPELLEALEQREKELGITPDPDIQRWGAVPRCDVHAQRLSAAQELQAVPYLQRQQGATYVLVTRLPPPHTRAAATCAPWRQAASRTWWWTSCCARWAWTSVPTRW